MTVDVRTGLLVFNANGPEPEPGIYYAHRTAEVESNVMVDENTTIWRHTVIRFGARIGRNCNIGEGVHIGPNVVVGNGCKIQNGTQLFEGVTLEDDVFIGPHVVFTNIKTPRAFVSRRDKFEKTTVKRGASIGANATIRCGVTIGEYALVGAGAVVTGGLRPHEIVTGVPAQHHAWACKCGEKLGVRAAWIAIWDCPTCKISYVMGASGTLVLQER